MKEQSGRDSLSDNRLPAFTRALLEVDRVASQRILLESDPSGGPMDRIERLIVPALVSIGNGWDDGSVSLSQVYMAGRLCETLVDAILPAADPQRRRNPIMAIAELEGRLSVSTRTSPPRSEPEETKTVADLLRGYDFPAALLHAQGLQRRLRALGRPVVGAAERDKENG